jgi:hypothetical protein
MTELTNRLNAYDQFVLRQLLDGESNPDFIWKKRAPCSLQEVMNSCRKLVRLNIAHLRGTPGRATSQTTYALDPLVREMLQYDSFDAGWAIVSGAIEMQLEHSRSQWPSSLILNLVHYVWAGRYYHVRNGGLVHELLKLYSRMLRDLAREPTKGRKKIAVMINATPVDPQRIRMLEKRELRIRNWRNELSVPYVFGKSDSKKEDESFGPTRDPFLEGVRDDQ